MSGKDRRSKDAPLQDDSARLMHELSVHQVELESQNEALRQAKDELEAARALYFDLYEHAPTGFLTLSEQGLILQTNIRAALLLGMEKAALINQPVSRFIFRDDQDAYYLCRRRLAESREAQTCGLRLLRQDGTQFWAQMDACTAQGVDGKPVHRIALSDISERKLVEAALHRSESEFRSMFEWSVVGGAQADPATGRLLRVNRKLCEITGYDADELLGLSFIEITHPDDRAANWQGYRNAIARRQETYCTDKRYVRKTGEIVWVNVQTTPQYDEQGRPLYTLAVIQDITARKEAEVAMRDRLELQARLAKIAATVPGVICSFKLRPDGSVCMPFASAALEKIYALYPEDVREDATPLLARIHPGDIGYVNETIAASASTMTAWRAEYRVRHPRKGEIWVEGHSMPQKEPDGSILWHGYIKEITDRKRMEAALRASERLYRAIGESIDYGVWISAADGRNLYSSDSFLKLVGLTQDKCADFGWITVLHPGDAERAFGTWMECVRTGTNWDMELRFRGVDGLWHDVLARGVPVRNERGEITHWAGINLDIGRQKQVEQSLRTSQLDLQRAQAVAQTGSWRLDIRRNELLWSDESHRIFGIPKGVPLSYETFLSVIHPDDRAFVDESWQAALRGERYNIEHRIVVNGEVRWVVERVELEFDSEGVLLGGLGSTQDITERKRSDAALAESESRLQLAMEAVSGLVYDWGRGANAAYCSIGLKHVFGAGAAGSHFSRVWWRSRVHPDDLRLIRTEVISCIRTGRDRIHLEYRMRHMDGHWVHVSDCALVIRDGAGRVVRVVGSLTDISARKNAEAALLRMNDTLEEKVAERTFEAEARARALLESERFTRATIDALGSSLCVLDASGCIVAVNRAWREFALANGGNPEQMSEGANYLVICDAAARAGSTVAAQVAELIRKAISGRRDDVSLEYECSSPQEKRWFAVNLSCFQGDGPLRMVLVHKDITERKRAAEAQFESARRLKGLAAHLETVREEQNVTISREVHDELGGTLTMLKLGLATTVGSLALDSTAQARFDQLLGQVDAAIKTVKRISAGLRPAMLDTLGLVATVNWHVAEFSRMTGIATEVRMPKHLKLSPVRNTAVFRIVQEALTNVARHASASKVSIDMKTHTGHLIVEVRDNGIGLREGDRYKSDSFGLIGMHERAQYLGGWLSMSGMPGEGACLTLHIPLEDWTDSERADDGDRVDR
jgi:hypothetical protein